LGEAFREGAGTRKHARSGREITKRPGKRHFGHCHHNTLQLLLPAISLSQFARSVKTSINCSGSTTVGVWLANGKLLNLCLFGYFYFSLSLFMWYTTSLSQGLKYPMKNSPVLTSRGILFTANGITQPHPIPHKLDMLI
jgi:hypothetical protein